MVSSALESFMICHCTSNEEMTRKDDTYVQADWKKIYQKLKLLGYSLSKINRIIGSQFGRNLYKNYAMALSSFKILEKLYGEPLSFSESKGYQVFELERTNNLAEFIGIVLGDGNISSRQITIALNSFHPWYVNYVVDLCNNLFHFPASVNRKSKENVVYIRLNRKGLVDQLSSMGLICGDKIKNNWNVPSWISKSPHYWSSCVKGLFDTDGSIYWQRSSRKRVSLKFTSMNSDFLHLFKNFCDLHSIRISPGISSWQIQSKDGVIKFQYMVDSEKIKYFYNYMKN